MIPYYSTTRLLASYLSIFALFALLLGKYSEDTQLIRSEEGKLPVGKHEDHFPLYSH